MEVNIEIQLFSIKPDSKEIWKNVKLPLLSLNLFLFGEIFILNELFYELTSIMKNQFIFRSVCYLY